MLFQQNQGVGKCKATCTSSNPPPPPLPPSPPQRCKSTALGHEYHIQGWSFLAVFSKVHSCWHDSCLLSHISAAQGQDAYMQLHTWM